MRNGEEAQDVYGCKAEKRALAGGSGFDWILASSTGLLRPFQEHVFAIDELAGGNVSALMADKQQRLMAAATVSVGAVNNIGKVYAT